MSDSEAPRSSGGGPLTPSAGPQQAGRRRRAIRWIGLAVVAAIVAAGGHGLARESQRDSDGDGLPDEIETTGWSVQAGDFYRTDPYSPDTDGDRLTDGDEAGARISPTQAAVVFAGFSDPLLPDSDRDNLSDAAEADLSLDPLDPDGDHDELTDGREVDVLGTDPDRADTDGDGFADGYEDANRESQGLDPLWFDVQVSNWDYAADFAKGLIAGDLWTEDSLAWLAGNLAAGASSSIPIAGTVLGAVGDARDAIASAIHADWVGVGFSVVGSVPGGDALAVPGKVSAFLARHPKLAAAATAMIAKTSWIPDSIKVKIARSTYPRWDELISAGASEKGLVRLMEGKVNIDRLADATRRPNYVSGASAPFQPDGAAGEQLLRAQLAVKASNVDLQVGFPTKSCAVGCNVVTRIVDVYADGIAHESKVGAVALSKHTEAQIRSDAWLIESGAIQGARWDFFPSGYTKTLGPNDQVLDVLEQFGIPFTIHWP